MCFCACHVHERERHRLSDISAEGHTRQQGTNVYLSMCVCMSRFNYSTTRIRRLSYAHHSSDGINTEGFVHTEEPAAS